MLSLHLKIMMNLNKTQTLYHKMDKYYKPFKFLSSFFKILFLLFLINMFTLQYIWPETDCAIENYRDIKKIILRAERFFNEKDNKAAVSVYKNALSKLKQIKRKFPNWTSMILIDIQVDRCNDRLKEISSLEKLKKIEKLEEIEQADFLENNIELKEEVYKKTESKVLQKSSKAFEEFLNLGKKGDGFLAAENYEKALEYYDKALLKNKEDKYLLTNKGIALFKLGFIGKAVDLFKELVKKDPYFSPAYYNLGDIYYSIGDLESAIKSYEDALELDSQDLRSSINLAVVYVKSGFYNKALDLLKRNLEYMPDSPDIHYNLGVIYCDYLFDKIMAVYHYSKYLEINPHAVDANEVSGWIEALKE